MNNILSRIAGWHERSKARQALGRLLDPGAVQDILNDGERTLRIKKMQFQYIVVQVHEQSEELIAGQIGRVADLFLTHNATLGDICSSIVTGYYGIPNGSADGLRNRLALVRSIVESERQKVRIVHGQCLGVAGLLETKSLCKYGVIISDFSNVLSHLLSIPFGATKEID
jgi:hypothetical protein